MDDKIIYSILDDGTCSYCGRPADLIELPDGDVIESDTCYFCEDYNDELLLIEKGFGQLTTLWYEGFEY